MASDSGHLQPTRQTLRARGQHSRSAGRNLPPRCAEIAGLTWFFPRLRTSTARNVAWATARSVGLLFAGLVAPYRHVATKTSAGREQYFSGNVAYRRRTQDGTETSAGREQHFSGPAVGQRQLPPLRSTTMLYRSRTAASTTASTWAGKCDDKTSLAYAWATRSASLPPASTQSSGVSRSPMSG